jgi:hypothetical protein
MEAKRLQCLLQAGDRAEVWLRVRHVFRLAGQPDQVVLDVTDASGRPAPRATGRPLPITVQLSSVAPLVRGQRVHLVREEGGVRLHVLPLGSE